MFVSQNHRCICACLLTAYTQETPIMAGAVEQTSPFFRLPGELRNRIYRPLAVKQTPIYIWGISESNDAHLVWSPRVPPFMITCRAIYDEVASIYYEENSFHFTEYALTAKRLQIRRQRAGRSASKMTSITITRAFAIGPFGATLQFSAEMAAGKVGVEKSSSDFVNSPFPGPYPSSKVKDLCYCTIRDLAGRSKGSLLDFVEQYLDLDGIWKGEEAEVVRCPECRRCRVVKVVREDPAPAPSPHAHQETATQA